MLTAQAFGVVQGGVELRADVSGHRLAIAYSATGAELTGSVEAALAATLLPAMRMQETLHAEEAVSPRLLTALPTIAQILRNWEQRFPVYGRYRTIPFDLRPRAVEQRAPRRKVAAFFTGGVDSMYTMARHRDELDALVFVHGFDVPLRNLELDSVVSTALRAAATELGKPLVEVRTNLRSVMDEHAHWDAYHGSALASVALLLTAEFERVYVPATLTYAHLVPLGSHPLLDPLWSTEDMEIVHDGCEASRLDKLAVLADDVVARRHLRVCWENRGGRYNCGACEKCLRTMVALRALGVLAQFETFPDTIKLRDLAQVELPEIRYTWEASLALLRQNGADRQLVRVLEARLHGRSARQVNRLVRTVRRGRSRLHDVRAAVRR